MNYDSKILKGNQVSNLIESGELKLRLFIESLVEMQVGDRQKIDEFIYHFNHRSPGWDQRSLPPDLTKKWVFYNSLFGSIQASIYRKKCCLILLNNLPTAFAGYRFFPGGYYRDPFCMVHTVAILPLFQKTCVRRHLIESLFNEFHIEFPDFDIDIPSKIEMEKQQSDLGVNVWPSEIDWNHFMWKKRT